MLTSKSSFMDYNYNDCFYYNAVYATVISYKRGKDIVRAFIIYIFLKMNKMTFCFKEQIAFLEKPDMAK